MKTTLSAENKELYSSIKQKDSISISCCTQLCSFILSVNSFNFKSGENIVIFSLTSPADNVLMQLLFSIMHMSNRVI